MRSACRPTQQGGGRRQFSRWRIANTSGNDRRKVSPALQSIRREQAMANDQTPERGKQDYRGDGPAKIGLTSDDQPDLVSPSGVNEGDHGSAEDAPAGGGTVNLDDDDMVHPRGKVTNAGRTWNEDKPSDAGDLGAPNVGMSDRNGPSDPDGKRSR
jgi:hypothetical protein